MQTRDIEISFMALDQALVDQGLQTIVPVLHIRRRLHSLHTDYDHTDIIFAASIQRGPNQGRAELLWLLRIGREDLLDLEVAHHFPQAIGAKQEQVARL